MEGPGDQRHAAPAARLRRADPSAPGARRAPQRFRSRRLVPPSAEGRWSAVADDRARRARRTWAAALTQQLLSRHGVVTRDVTALEPVPGGFSTIYPVLRRLEDTGRVRRGYFVAGLGGAQFAEPGAVDLLRAERDPGAAAGGRHAGRHRSGQSVRRAGGVAGVGRQLGTQAPAASAGARVVLVDGYATGWIARGDRASCWSRCPTRSPIDRDGAGRWRASWCAWRICPTAERRGWLIAELNGEPADGEPAGALLRRGRLRRHQRRPAAARAARRPAIGARGRRRPDDCPRPTRRPATMPEGDTIARAAAALHRALAGARRHRLRDRPGAPGARRRRHAARRPHHRALPVAWASTC